MKKFLVLFFTLALFLTTASSAFATRVYVYGPKSKYSYHQNLWMDSVGFARNMRIFDTAADPGYWMTGTPYTVTEPGWYCFWAARGKTGGVYFSPWIYISGKPGPKAVFLN